MILSDFIKRKEMYLIEKIVTYKIVVPILPSISKTSITPNIITILNILIGFLAGGLIIANKGNMASILIFMYLFFDILDGNLARYKKLESKLGAKIDNLGDRVIYNFLLISFLVTNKSYYILMIILIILHNLHGIIATFYIVPNLRRLDKVQRFGVKKNLFDKGIIMGMDLSLLVILMICTLMSGSILFMGIAVILYIMDIVYRCYELKINIELQREGNING